MAKPWQLTPVSKLNTELKTNPQFGLTSKEARERLAKLGPNRLVTVAPPSPWLIFISQFQDFMVLVLVGTVAVSLFLGEYLDACAILAIVLLNSILGFTQEYRAEKSLDALRKMTAPHAKVIRDGHKILLESEQLVPGDIILLEPGDRVPADARLITSDLLSVDESTLTGESLTVNKDALWIGQLNTPLGDIKNSIFKSTLITRGYAKGVVVRTGMDTEIGEIADLLQEKPEVATPLQRRLDQLGKILVVACLVIVAVVYLAGVHQGFPVYKMFMVGVTLAVAAIPEGLPAVVTIALSVGVQRMSKRKAIIRQLPAVETLGCATVICSDKTGTLTLNQMEVQKVWAPPHSLEIADLKKVTILSRSDSLYYTAAISALCTKAEAYSATEIFGEPTEVALARFAFLSGLEQANLKRDYFELANLPFDAERKRMSVVVRKGQEHFVFMKGAPDVVLQRCTKILYGEEIVTFTQERRQEALRVLESLADQALRVLAMAYKPLKTPITDSENWETDLIFTGLVGMLDPPRPEVAAFVRAAKQGGIRTIMVTGDHTKTASAIGKRIGILSGDTSEVITGAEWETLTPLQQQAQIKNTAIFARVAPAHKLSIVRALQKNGEIVAMTGDGVNDAPAVREADIGISMGIQGTDVTREASDMVLLDDNYGTIISAVQEGRAIYDNIRKFIRYLLGCNVGEVLTMLVATLVGLPLPLVPLQILWMNLVTDGLPAIALGLEPTTEDLMLQNPRNPKEGILARGLLLKILFSGTAISLASLAIFVLGLALYPDDVNRARTMAFTALVLAQLIFAFQCRSERYTLFELPVGSNLYLVIAVFVSGLAQVFVIYNEFMQEIFLTTPLSFDDWVLVVIFAEVPLFLETVVRLTRRLVKRRFSLLKV